MSQTLEPLILDLVEWVAKQPRRHIEIMEAWRTSCPRLTVLEDTFDAGYLGREWQEGEGATVVITPIGRDFLKQHGRPSAVDTKNGQGKLAVGG